MSTVGDYLSRNTPYGRRIYNAAIRAGFSISDDISHEDLSVFRGYHPKERGLPKFVRDMRIESEQLSERKGLWKELVGDLERPLAFKGQKDLYLEFLIEGIDGDMIPVAVEIGPVTSEMMRDRGQWTTWFNTAQEKLTGQMYIGNHGGAEARYLWYLEWVEDISLENPTGIHYSFVGWFLRESRL